MADEQQRAEERHQKSGHSLLGSYEEKDQWSSVTHTSKWVLHSKTIIGYSAAKICSYVQGYLELGNYKLAVYVPRTQPTAEAIVVLVASNWQNSGICGRWGVDREGDSNFTASEE